MGWIIFMILAWSVAFLIVPLKHWKKSWAVGIAAMTVVYILDNTLVYLGAFRFWHGYIYISGLPLLYWLVYFPGGITFDYFRPHRHKWRPVYILTVAGMYLAVELVMLCLGYFQYFNWNATRSYLLNIVGFTISMWFAEWLEEGRENETAE